MKGNETKKESWIFSKTLFLYKLDTITTKGIKFVHISNKFSDIFRLSLSDTARSPGFLLPAVFDAGGVSWRFVPDLFGTYRMCFPDLPANSGIVVRNLLSAGYFLPLPAAPCAPGCSSFSAILFADIPAAPGFAPGAGRSRRRSGIRPGSFPAVRREPGGLL